MAVKKNATEAAEAAEKGKTVIIPRMTKKLILGQIAKPQEGERGKGKR